LIPPFIGFFGKQSVIYSAIDSGFYFMTIIAILVSVISATYYLKLIKEAYYSKSIYNDSNISKDSVISNPLNKEDKSNLTLMNTQLENQENKDKEFTVFSSFRIFLDYILKIENNYVDLKVLNFSNVHAFIISFLTLSIILFFLNPSILMNSATIITLNYFYL
jgi:NADH-ubiquinone oxidoreductase chain 2